MSILGSGAADAIKTGLSQASVSAQLSGWGSAVVSEIQSHAMITIPSGKFTGTAPSSGGPLSGGQATGGIISGLDAVRLASAISSQAGYGSVSSKLTAQAQAIVNHVQTGTVAFASVPGTCTNTPSSPGTAANLSTTSGVISGLDGPTLAQAIHSGCSYPGAASSKLIGECTALVNYIMTNAQGSLAANQLSAIAPAGGGAVTAGAGAGGTIL